VEGGELEVEEGEGKETGLYPATFLGGHDSAP